MDLLLLQSNNSPFPLKLACVDFLSSVTKRFLSDTMSKDCNLQIHQNGHRRRNVDIYFGKGIVSCI